MKKKQRNISHISISISIFTAAFKIIYIYIIAKTGQLLFFRLFFLFFFFFELLFFSCGEARCVYTHLTDILYSLLYLYLIFFFVYRTKFWQNLIRKQKSEEKELNVVYFLNFFFSIS